MYQWGKGDRICKTGAAWSSQVVSSEERGQGALDKELGDPGTVSIPPITGCLILRHP